MPASLLDQQEALTTSPDIVKGSLQAGQLGLLSTMVVPRLAP